MKSSHFVRYLVHTLNQIWIAYLQRLQVGPSVRYAQPTRMVNLGAGRLLSYSGRTELCVLKQACNFSIQCGCRRSLCLTSTQQLSLRSALVLASQGRGPMVLDLRDLRRLLDLNVRVRLQERQKGLQTLRLHFDVSSFARSTPGG